MSKNKHKNDEKNHKFGEKYLEYNGIIIIVHVGVYKHERVPQKSFVKKSVKMRERSPFEKRNIEKRGLGFHYC